MNVSQSHVAEKPFKKNESNEHVYVQDIEPQLTVHEHMIVDP